MQATDDIARIIDSRFITIFKEVAQNYELEYGDISPEQVNKVDDIKQQLADLLGAYVHQNNKDICPAMSIEEEYELYKVIHKEIDCEVCCDN